MNIAVWILLSFLAAWGLVEAVGLLARLWRRGGVREGYYVVPLYDEPEKTEAILRANLARARRGGGTMLLLDLGADAESLAICERMECGALTCKENEFFEIIRKLDEKG
jgi:hypothetical protein